MQPAAVPADGALDATQVRNALLQLLAVWLRVGVKTYASKKTCLDPLVGILTAARRAAKAAAMRTGAQSAAAAAGCPATSGG